MDRDGILVQPEKALAPIVSSPSFSVNDVMLVHPLKAELLIVVTLAGISTDVNLVFSKALLPINTRVDGKDMDVKLALLQPLNA